MKRSRIISTDLPKTFSFTEALSIADGKYHDSEIIKGVIEKSKAEADRMKVPYNRIRFFFDCLTGIPDYTIKIRNLNS